MGDRCGGIGAVVRSVGAGLSALADLALPGECAGCGTGQPGRAGLCAGCASAVERRPVPVRMSRGRARLPVVYALGGYREPLSDLIIAQKEHGRLDLARPLGTALGEVARAAVGALEDGSAGRSIILVPIPSAKAAERRRGQDPVLRMARVAAAGLRRDGVRAEVVRALRHGRAVADQVGLSVAGRAANLSGAMRVTSAGHRSLSAGPGVVVLLDDVCTSGATLGEGARALGSVAGFAERGGRVVAAVLAGPVR